MVKSPGEIPDDKCCGPGVNATLQHEMRKGGTRHVFVGDPAASVVMSRVENPDDVRVRQLGGRASLAEESLHRTLFIFSFLQDLECNVAPEKGVESSKNLSITAITYKFEDFKTTDVAWQARCVPP